MGLLAKAGVMPDRPRALLAAAPDDPAAARIPVLRRLMTFAMHADENAYLARSRERDPGQHVDRRFPCNRGAVHASGSVRCRGLHLQSRARVVGEFAA